MELLCDVVRYKKFSQEARAHYKSTLNLDIDQEPFRTIYNFAWNQGYSACYLDHQKYIPDNDETHQIFEERLRFSFALKYGFSWLERICLQEQRKLKKRGTPIKKWAYYYLFGIANHFSLPEVTKYH